MLGIPAAFADELSQSRALPSSPLATRTCELVRWSKSATQGRRCAIVGKTARRRLPTSSSQSQSVSRKPADFMPVSWDSRARSLTYCVHSPTVRRSSTIPRSSQQRQLPSPDSEHSSSRKANRVLSRFQGATGSRRMWLSNRRRCVRPQSISGVVATPSSAVAARPVAAQRAHLAGRCRTPVVADQPCPFCDRYGPAT